MKVIVTVTVAVTEKQSIATHRLDNLKAWAHRLGYLGVLDSVATSMLVMWGTGDEFHMVLECAIVQQLLINKQGLSICLSNLAVVQLQ